MTAIPRLKFVFTCNDVSEISRKMSSDSFRDFVFKIHGCKYDEEKSRLVAPNVEVVSIYDPSINDYIIFIVDKNLKKIIVFCRDVRAHLDIIYSVLSTTKYCNIKCELVDVELS